MSPKSLEPSRPVICAQLKKKEKKKPSHQASPLSRLIAWKDLSRIQRLAGKRGKRLPESAFHLFFWGGGVSPTPRFLIRCWSALRRVWEFIKITTRSGISVVFAAADSHSSGSKSKLLFIHCGILLNRNIWFSYNTAPRDLLMFYSNMLISFQNSPVSPHFYAFVTGV